MNKITKAISVVSGAALALSMVATALPASAQTNVNVSANAHIQGGMMQRGGERGGQGGQRGPGAPGMMKPGVVGKVTAISGTTLTLSGHQGPMNASTTVTYTVDASAATVVKNNATSTFSVIAVNDTVFAQGTVTGTNVVATTIRDGAFARGGEAWGGDKGHMMASSSLSAVLGNGQPVVAGKVTAVNGSSVSITNSSNVSYTIDTTSAKMLDGKGATTVTALQVGDSVLVQGTTNGNSITASTVINQSQKGTSTDGKPQSRGIFQSIGSFFSRLFGF